MHSRTNEYVQSHLPGHKCSWQHRGAKPKRNWQVSIYQLILLKGRNITELVVHYNQDEHYDIEKIVATSLSHLPKLKSLKLTKCHLDNSPCLTSHGESEMASSSSIVMLAGILPGKVRDLASRFPNLKHLDLSTVTSVEQYRSPLALLLRYAENVKLPSVTSLKTTIHGEFWNLQSSVLHCIDDLSGSFPNLSALSLTDMSTDASSD